MPIVGELRQLEDLSTGRVKIYVLLWTRGFLEGWEDVDTGELRILAPVVRELVDRGPAGTPPSPP